MPAKYTTCPKCSKKGLHRPKNAEFRLLHAGKTLCRYCRTIFDLPRKEAKHVPKKAEKSKAEKFYELRRPCDNCPFRTDIEPYLRRERAVEIVKALERGTFSCHKTVDYSQHHDGEVTNAGVAGPTEKMCAGALIMQEKSGYLGQMGRIAERLGVYDRDKLDLNAPVFTSSLDFIDAQEGEAEDEFDPCHVSDDGCEAPAGYMTAMGPVRNKCTFELPCCYSCGEYTCENCSRVHPENDDEILCVYCYEGEYGDAAE